jgi:hypothetical protein
MFRRGKPTLHILLFFSVLSGARMPVAGQIGPCDPGLKQDESNPYGYRLRGNRCEGIYIRLVGGAPLTIASWTQSFENYNLASPAPLTMEWDIPSGKSVSLRAEGLRRRLYFRMDASPSGNSFTWQTSLLTALGIVQSELGITASYRAAVNGEEHEILLPLRVAQKEKSVSSGAYRLVLIPGEEFRELFVTLTSADSASRTPLKRDEPLRYGYYPADRPIEIPISGLTKPGIYHLQIGASLLEGGASTTDFWFYHSGK